MEDPAEMFVGHAPCEDCGSSDACGVYADGHTHCFSCGKHRKGEREMDLGELMEQESTRMAAKPMGSQFAEELEYKALPSRGLTEETCRLWRYGTSHGAQVAQYFDDDGTTLVAQKIKRQGKKFSFPGGKDAHLYGKWRASKRGKLVITEGEIDALTVSQLQDHKWAVVSVQGGAHSAKKCIAKDLEWIETYSDVVFMFDMDEPGREAAKECAMMLTPGKASIANLPFKDANECLQKGLGDKVIQAMWDAKPFRPDGIVDAGAALEMIRERGAGMPIASFPWTQVQKMTQGIVPKQIITFCAGSGVGKSETVREIELSLIKQDLKVGVVALEEGVERSALGLVGMAMGKQLHLMPEEPEDVEGFKEAWAKTIEGRVWFYDHFGSMDAEVLVSKIRYLRQACGVDVVILDHISIVVSGLEDGDERRVIDNLMTRLRSLTQETGLVLILVSHLKRPKGTPHEEGGRTSLAQLRGSGAIGHLSDLTFGLERNQQDPQLKDMTKVRLLKNRRTGHTGLADWLEYDHDTGRLCEVDAPAGVSDNDDDPPF